MKRWLSHPALWLVVQPALLLVWLWYRGSLVPQIVADTKSYEGIEWGSASSIVSGIRTFGYPLFLRAAALFGAGYAAVPELHFIVHMLAVWIFYWGLRHAGMRRWTSFCAASTMFYSHSLLELGAIVFPDPLAVSLAIASAGFLLAVTANARSAINWAGFTVFTLLVYHVQPAYLFVTALWPMIGIFLARFVVRRGLSRSDLLRFSGCLLASAVVPFVMFCGARWLLVGHFGLVSFGGYNVIGVAGQLLDDQVVRSLPNDLQPFAQAIVARRRQLSGWEHPDSFLAMERMFNPTVWQLAVPAARELYSNDPVHVNRQLTRLSQFVLRERPRAYGRWLIWNVKHGLVYIIVLTAKDKAVLLLLTALLVSHFVAAVRGPNRNALPESLLSDAADIRFVESHLLFWLSLGFAIGKLLLVALVEPANDRYMTGAMIFLPAVLASCLAPYLRQVWTASSASQRRK